MTNRAIARSRSFVSLLHSVGSAVSKPRGFVPRSWLRFSLVRSSRAAQSESRDFSTARAARSARSAPPVFDADHTLLELSKSAALALDVKRRPRNARLSQTSSARSRTQSFSLTRIIVTTRSSYSFTTGTSDWPAIVCSAIDADDTPTPHQSTTTLIANCAPTRVINATRRRASGDALQRARASVAPAGA